MQLLKPLYAAMWWTLTLSTAAAQLPAQSSLDDLQAEQAFAIHGISDSGAYGFGVSTIGDFNDDGFDDLIISARTADNSGTNSGSCYVVFGAAQPLPVNFDVAQLNGSNGFAMHGESANDTACWSVSEAGDVNNDGLSDLIVGARSANPITVQTGAAYVVFGTSATMPSEFNLSTLDGNNGFRLIGEASGDFFGDAVSAAGDVNHDGVDDLLIGATRADNNGTSSGAAYVVFGRANFPASVAVADLDGNDGFLLNAEAAGDGLGIDVSQAGDFNGDGIDDMLVGAYQADPVQLDLAGKAYVVFGRDSNHQGGDFPAILELANLDSSTGVVLHGANAGDTFGRVLTAAGDINHDGTDDIAVQAPSEDSNASSAGAVYIIYGSTSLITSPLQVSNLDGTNGFVMLGASSSDQTGQSLSYGGDFNGDGRDDLMIGVPNADSPVTNAGSSYLLYGWDLPFPASFDIDNLPNANGLVIEGNDSWDRAGIDTSQGGDFNGDGYSDLIISATGNDFNGESVGTVFVIFGQGDLIFSDTFEN